MAENNSFNFFESEEYLGYVRASKETEEEKRLRLEKERLEQMQSSLQEEPIVEPEAEPVIEKQKQEIVESIPEMPEEKEFNFFESEEYKTYTSKKPAQLQKLGDDISFSRKFDYGTAQEMTALGSAWQITKAAIEAGFDKDRDYEDVRAANEAKRQEKIFEEFPEFRGREEDAAVIAGRVGQALVDPVTFFVPWAKIAKAGKIASLGAGGSFGATDIALRQEALYGEVSKEEVALGFGLGVAGAGVGEVVSAYMRRGVDDVIEVVEETGKKSKPVKIKGATKIKPISPDKIEAAEKAAIETAKANKEITKSLGVVYRRLAEIDEARTLINKQLKNLTKKPTTKKEIEDALKAGGEKIGVRKQKPEVALKRKLTLLQKEKIKLDKEAEKLVTEAAPIKLVDMTSEALLQGFKQKVLDEGMARALVQEMTRPLFGGVIGAGFGATFSEEGGDNTGLYASAVTGFMLGAFQKRIQSKQFELIPTNIKQAAVDELEIEYRRSNYNVLKSLTAGSHAQELLAYSSPVVNYAMRMFKLQGGGVRAGNVTKDLSVEESKIIQLGNWRNEYIEIVSEHTDDVLVLAGKIVNNTKLKSNKHSFLTPEDLLNKNYKKAKALAKEIDSYTLRFKKYAEDSGLTFQDEAQYGLTQMFRLSVFDDILDSSGNVMSKSKRYKKIRDRLKNAFILQSRNENKLDSNVKVLSDKEATDVANTYLKSSTQRRQNSLWSEESGDALFAGNKVASDAAGDERFILNAARHFDKKRTLYNQEARASVSDLFEQNPALTLKQLTENTIPVAEFTRAFGAKGEGIKEIFKAIEINYLKIQDPKGVLLAKHKGNQDKALKELMNDFPAMEKLINQEKEKIKDSISAYFQMYKIESAPSTASGQTTAVLLQSLLATTKLTKVAIPSLGDLLQTITNSGYGPASKSALAQMKIKYNSNAQQALALGGKSKQVKGKDATFLDNFLGNNRYDSIIEREMADVFLYGQGGAARTQRYAMDATRKFFETVQLGRITRLARNFAFDAGTYRAMDIAKKMKGTKVKSSLQKEIDSFGLTPENFIYLKQFKNLDEAMKDATAKGYLNKAGLKAADRDALIPTVGNRRLFAQTKRPEVKFLGSFLSWAQAKTSQTNALVARVEQGDGALALRMMAALPLYYAVMNAQISLSTNEDYKKERFDATNLEKFGETIGFSGITTFIPEKIRGMLQYGGFGTEPTHQLVPVLNLISDLMEIPLKPLGEAFDPEGTPIKTLGEEVADVVPFGRDVKNIVKELNEEETSDRTLKSEGGIVKGKDDVPYTEDNAIDRTDKFTGQSYSDNAGIKKQLIELGLVK